MRQIIRTRLTLIGEGATEASDSTLERFLGRDIVTGMIRQDSTVDDSGNYLKVSSELIVIRMDHLLSGRV